MALSDSNRIAIIFTIDINPIHTSEKFHTTSAGEIAPKKTGNIQEILNNNNNLDELRMKRIFASE